GGEGGEGGGGDCGGVGEMDYREAVEPRKLDEQSGGRAVRRRLDRHRPQPLVEWQIPSDLLGRHVDDGEPVLAYRAGDRVFAVRRDVDVVQPALDRDALLERERVHIDHVKGAGIVADAHDDAAAVLADGD